MCFYFQLASSTLDASAKIYAGRVDAIHSEMYKVLTGLGRGGSGNNEKHEKQGQSSNNMYRNIYLNILLSFDFHPIVLLSMGGSHAFFQKLHHNNNNKVKVRAKG